MCQPKVQIRSRPLAHFQKELYLDIFYTGKGLWLWPIYKPRRFDKRHLGTSQRVRSGAYHHIVTYYGRLLHFPHEIRHTT